MTTRSSRCSLAAVLDLLGKPCQPSRLPAQHLAELLALRLIKLAREKCAKQLLDVRRRARRLAALDLTFAELEKPEENFKFGKHVLHYASMCRVCKEIVTGSHNFRFLPCVPVEAFR